MGPEGSWVYFKGLLGLTNTASCCSRVYLARNLLLDSPIPCWKASQMFHLLKLTFKEYYPSGTITYMEKNKREYLSQEICNNPSFNVPKYFNNIIDKDSIRGIMCVVGTYSRISSLLYVHCFSVIIARVEYLNILCIIFISITFDSKTKLSPIEISLEAHFTNVNCTFFNVNNVKIFFVSVINFLSTLITHADPFKTPKADNQGYSQEHTPVRGKKVVNKNNSATLVLRSGKISPLDSKKIVPPATPSTLFRNLSLETSREDWSETFVDATSSSIPLDKETKKRNRSAEQEQSVAKKADQNDSFTKFSLVPVAHSTPGSQSSLETTSHQNQSLTLKRKMSIEGMMDVIIVHKDKPMQSLTNDQMADIMKKIDLQMDELKNEEVGRVDIEKVNYNRAGFIKLSINNDYTLSWLEDCIRKINVSNVIQLKVEKMEQEQKFIKCKVKILDRKIEETVFFKKIQLGNPGLDVSKWFIINSVTLRDDQMLVIFKIDEESYEHLKSQSDPFKIKFGALGKIKIMLDEKVDSSGEPAKKQPRTLGSKDVQI